MSYTDRIMTLRDAGRQAGVSEILSTWRVLPVERDKAVAKKNQNAEPKVKGKKARGEKVLTGDFAGQPVAGVEESQQIETAIEPPINEPPQAAEGPKTMTLTLKGLDKRGRNGIYTGAAVAIRIPVGAFPDKTAPASLEVGDGQLAGPKAKRSQMTPEERKAARKAQPKLTLAEKVAKAEERAAKLREKLAKGAQAGEAQPAL